MTPGPSRQFPLALPHRPSLTRDDLIVTKANQTAVAALDAWPNWPHPVLLVVGPEGAGKSHLAAAWRELAGAADFDGRIPEAPQPFAIVIDGLEDWIDRERELFEVLNAARLGGGFVMATARRAPAVLSLRLPDLRSRLRAATQVQIAEPDDALLRGVLHKHFADRQLAVDARLVDYMAERMERSLGAALRIAGEVDREALASKEKVTRGLIRRILGEEERARHDGAGNDA
ncbi:DnaA ATPase domain-containing protein [Aureimonas leprariae]|uniref:Chromosomal replication initiator protein DnaA domain-containing protein n=1 Tax=Plantimonas leprariae TaxID=2615207 RepID=A0A7V7U0L8_9HYPH|nr:DnaA/Hda family protein [Aureimonas leprariae]KAB0680694.1 hypothetical protein F6X38_06710 [Aureimonas leprariae]